MQTHSTGATDGDQSIPGDTMVDQLEVPERFLNQLYAALLLTAVGIFVAANALLGSSAVLRRSLPIAATSFGVLGLFCALSRRWRRPAAALAACCALLFLTVHGPQAWTVPALAGVLAIGVAYTLFHLRLSPREIGMAFGMAVIGTAAILGSPGAFTSFDMIERAHAGHVHMDTLYHASMAAMIKNYGVTSTGLNGLVETPYHVLSHTLFAAVSLVSRAPVIEVYGVANWVLFAPLLIFAVTASCLMLDSQARLDPIRVWFSVCVLLAICPYMLTRWGVWDSFFASESYLLSLSLMLLSLPLLFKTKLMAVDLLLLVASTALMSAAKASVGLIFIELFCIRLVFLNRECNIREIIACVMMAAVAAAVVFDSAVANRGSIFFAPLDFIEHYSFLGRHLTAIHGALHGGESARWWVWLLAGSAIGGFVALHFLVSWLVIARAVGHHGIRSVLSSPIATLSLGGVASGLAIVLSCRIFGGSAYYFTNVAFFISLPAAAAMLGTSLPKQTWSSRSALILATVLVVVVSINPYLNASAFSGERVARRHSMLVDRLLAARTLLPRQVVLRADPATLADNPLSSCRAQPFVFPALSERPWIGVIAGDNACRYYDYGYENYGPSAVSHEALAPPRLPAVLGQPVVIQTLP
jgi:hypothetical protein